MLTAFLDAECTIFGGSGDTYDAFISVLGTVRTIVRILQIVVPIALIVWGSLDLGKSVIAGDEKKIKENQGKFVKRIVAAVLVFLVPFIVSLIMNYLSGDEWKACWNASSGTSITDNNAIKRENQELK